eukprot:gene4154-15746_t
MSAGRREAVRHAEKPRVASSPFADAVAECALAAYRAAAAELLPDALRDELRQTVVSIAISDFRGG